MAYHGDKFLHIEEVTIVNNRDDTLHYVTKEEIKSRTSLTLQSVVEERGFYYFKGPLLV